MGFIYKITSPSNKIYVGKTYNLRTRKAAHRHSVKKGSNIILHNSIRKYGWDAHKFEVIEECADEVMNEREMYWISELKTYCYENEMGMNMTIGGDGQRSSWMHDEKRRVEQSNRYMGSGNPFFGKKHTDEYKKAKSKQVSEYNKANGIKVSQIGIERGRLASIEPVVCYNTSGYFIKEYESIKEAVDELGVNHSSVSCVCRLKRTHTKGFVFRYKTDNYPVKIDVGEIKHQAVSRPVCLLSEDLEIINTFPSAKEAAEFFGLPKTTINRAAMYNWGKPIRTGHQFIYKDLYEELMQEVA